MLGRRIAVRVSACVLLGALAACSGSSGASSRRPSAGASAVDAADRAFLQMMIPHHQRAIAVGRLAETAGTDPRVTAFGARIVREQTPELNAMTAAAHGLSLNFTRGADTATDRISDTQLAALKALTGRAFDREFVRLNISSETGAYEMARTELADGSDAAAKKVATGISHSPSEIAELTALGTALG